MSLETNLGSRIQKSLAYNPARIVPISLDILSAIIEEENRYLVAVWPKNVLLSLTSGNLNCLYYTMDLIAEVLTFPFAKNSTYSKKLNKMTLYLFEFGLQQVLKNRCVKKSQCGEYWKQRAQLSSEFQSQMLTSMATTFCFYALEIFIAVATFLSEVLLFRFKK